jgi:hypothetical protein
MVDAIYDPIDLSAAQTLEDEGGFRRMGHLSKGHHPSPRTAMDDLASGCLDSVERALKGLARIGVLTA